MGKSCSIESETCGFKCTAWDGVLENGKSAWKEIDKVIESIPCDTCKEHAKPVMSGVHDLVNVGLGEKPFDEKNFKKFVNEVNCVYDKCKEDGRCK